MTEHDVLVGFRLRLFTLADELGNVSAACRAMGVDRSTYYRLKAMVDRWGLEALGPRAPAAADAQPDRPAPRAAHHRLRARPSRLGPRRIAAELAREKWGGMRISEHGVWRVLRRVGLNTRVQAPGADRRHRDPYERQPDRAAARAPHRRLAARREGPARLLLRRPARRHQGHRLAIHRHRRRLGASAGPSCTPPSATRAPATPASWCTASRASSPPPAGSCTRSPPTTARSSAPASSARPSHALGARQRFIRAGRPNTNGCVERVQLTILEECWRPAFARSLVPKTHRPRPRPRRVPHRLQLRPRPHRAPHPTGACPQTSSTGPARPAPR